MNYIITRKSLEEDLIDDLVLDGVNLPSRKKVFIINGSKVKRIIITDRKLARPFIVKIVNKKYQKLIDYLTELLVDDESGTALQEILSQGEKFKLEIKTKYRKYLKKKEFEEMSAKLDFIAKKAETDQIMMYNNYMNMMNSKESNRSR